jgi:hypothetical protein
MTVNRFVGFNNQATVNWGKETFLHPTVKLHFSRSGVSAAAVAALVTQLISIRCPVKEEEIERSPRGGSKK